ncbi:hypothetical protein [Defluviimonas sp. WL0075]|uniref:Uncharacterized protein n=1 Tax=Albidovulum sediminicola TaxID=2984331 RepID=A0ABT2Z415_9RHOB|nr:hypothetical protein [Defluviimonas sp. WL0075]MCV2865750.1 hypothetical protein [Defluviimonas sp. WL0075]
MQIASGNRGYYHRGMLVISAFPQFFGLMVCIASAGLSCAASRASAELHFDPATCSENPGGKMIVRLVTGIAFAVPPDTVDIASAEPDPDGEPGEPPGCPGNPFRTVALSLLPHGEPIFDTRTTALFWNVDIRIIKLIGNDYGAEANRYLLESYTIFAEQRGNCGKSPEGLSICYHCREDADRSGYCEDKNGMGASSDGRIIERAGFHVVDAESATGSDDLPWIASCGSESSGGARLCFAEYTPQSGLSVAYAFGLTRLDMSVLREMDQSLRDGIQELRAPEYDGEDLR